MKNKYLIRILTLINKHPPVVFNNELNRIYHNEFKVKVTSSYVDNIEDYSEIKTELINVEKLIDDLDATDEMVKHLIMTELSFHLKTLSNLNHWKPNKLLKEIFQ
ncbi:hypothetical protein [Ureaplasma canigenitalium]|uniref:hypothetical protein n=1 Tax=Ureaplasma canigenitalium TaxID=42092 RepID=UPI0004E1A36C|nr:hypothetical protein [Ureaplasma canigenitalium]